MNDNALSTLYHLYFSDDPMTTTELGKLVFDPEETEEVRNADRKVRHYLDKYDNLVRDISVDGTNHYVIKKDKVHIGMGMMYVVTEGGEEITTGFGEVMVYDGGSDSPEVVSIESRDENGG